MTQNTCLVCSVDFETTGRPSKYCGRKCRSAARLAASPLSCASCAKPMFPSPGAVQGKSMCQPCRREQHGSSTAYARGCRCHECRAAKAADMQGFLEKHRTENGVNYSTTWRRNFRDVYGFWPNKTGGDWIDPRERRSIYDRDGWACYLCSEVLSPDTDPNDPKGLTLDHVTPRSVGGTDAPENLKTCCRECNTLKGAKVLQASV